MPSSEPPPIAVSSASDVSGSGDGSGDGSVHEHPSRKRKAPDRSVIFPPLLSENVLKKLAAPPSNISFGRRPPPDVSWQRMLLSAYRSPPEDTLSSASVSVGPGGVPRTILGAKRPRFDRDQSRGAEIESSSAASTVRLHASASRERTGPPRLAPSYIESVTTEQRLHAGRFARQLARVGVVEEATSETASFAGERTGGTETMIEDGPSEWDGVDLPLDLPGPRQRTTRFGRDIPDPKTVFRDFVFGLADHAQAEALGCRWEIETWGGKDDKKPDRRLTRVLREVTKAGGRWDFANPDDSQADILVVPAFVFSKTQPPKSPAESTKPKTRTNLRPLQTVVPADWVFACVAAKAISGVEAWAEGAIEQLRDEPLASTGVAGPEAVASNGKGTPKGMSAKKKNATFEQWQSEADALLGQRLLKGIATYGLTIRDGSNMSQTRFKAWWKEREGSVPNKYFWQRYDPIFKREAPEFKAKSLKRESKKLPVARTVVIDSVSEGGYEANSKGKPMDEIASRLEEESGAETGDFLSGGTEIGVEGDGHPAGIADDEDPAAARKPLRIPLTSASSGGTSAETEAAARALLELSG